MERLMHPRSTEQSGKLCQLPLVVPSFSPLFLFVATSVQWPHFFSAHNSTGQTSSVGAQPSEPFWKCQHLWSHRSVTSSYRLCPARYVLHAAFPYLFQLSQRSRHHTSPTLCKAGHYLSWNPWGKVCYQHIFTLIFFSLDQMKYSYNPFSLRWPRTHGFDWRSSPPPSNTEVLL